MASPASSPTTTALPPWSPASPACSTTSSSSSSSRPSASAAKVAGSKMHSCCLWSFWRSLWTDWATSLALCARSTALGALRIQRCCFSVATACRWESAAATAASSLLLLPRPLRMASSIAWAAARRSLCRWTASRSRRGSRSMREPCRLLLRELCSEVLLERTRLSVCSSGHVGSVSWRSDLWTGFAGPRTLWRFFSLRRSKFAISRRPASTSIASISAVDKQGRESDLGRLRREIRDCMLQMDMSEQDLAGDADTLERAVRAGEISLRADLIGLSEARRPAAMRELWRSIASISRAGMSECRLPADETDRLWLWRSGVPMGVQEREQEREWARSWVERWGPRGTVS
mmetsp:Transcript_39889/g.85448  ORF Transcript_39889/g.85448 Transcript_39889/m.85448 type:complete len:347 (+) Transcript_39889:470-1510(+)